MISLIDSDILVYECGFSSDSNAKNALLMGWGLKTKKECSPEQLDELTLAKEPLEYCLKIVKNKIEEILKITEAEDYKLYLTGKDNFRNKIQPDYKANRDPGHKPHWYKEIKEYLIEVHGAEVIDGMEADDKLSIEQVSSEEWTCICTKDKDLDMVPGFHYNWSKSKYELGVYHVEEIEGLRFFYTQILTGDATDNIPGLFKATGKRATKKFKEPIQSMETELEMYEHVKECYGEYDFTGIAQCLYMLKKEGVMWEAPNS